MTDVGDKETVTRRKKAYELTREREVEELRGLLATYGGRAFIWRLMEEARVHHLSFVADNPHLTTFNEGRRSIGNWVLSEALTADPNSYTVMRNEALDRTSKSGKDDNG